jgi:hypothetical protein
MMINVPVLVLTVILLIILLVCYIVTLHNKSLNIEDFKPYSKPKHKMVLHHNITHNAGDKLLEIVRKNGLKADWVNIKPRWTPTEVEEYLLKQNLDWAQIEGPLPTHDNIPWDSPHIAYTIILDDPLNRALKTSEKDYKKWIEENPHHVDNYTTRWLLGKWCGHGGCGDRGPPVLTDRDLTDAQNKLKKFDIAILMEDLPESAKAFKNKLGWKHWNIQPLKDTKTPKEKINDPDVYQKLLDQNKHDTKLYNYAKKHLKDI